MVYVKNCQPRLIYIGCLKNVHRIELDAIIGDAYTILRSSFCGPIA